MAIYTGLNVSLHLNDVNNSSESLRNLGMNRKDFDHIRGLSNVLETRNQLHLLGNLDVDQQKQTYLMYRSAVSMGAELDNIDDTNKPLPYDIRINNQLRAGAIKYKYLDGSNTLKGADISTSRVSSWSQIGDGPIFYGADVNINPYDGSDASTGDPSKSILKLKDIVFKGEFSPKRFAAEVPTHTVTVNVNGVDRELYAMRNIPMRFEGNFSSAKVTYSIDNASVAPTVLFVDPQNFDPPLEVAVTGPTSTVNHTAEVTNIKGGDKFIDIYYRPDGLKKLTLPAMQMFNFPAIELRNLNSISVANNKLENMPDWFAISGGNLNGHTQALTSITISGNPLYKSSDVANTQLQKLPRSVQTLNMHGCFSDSTPIDISQLKQGGGSTTLVDSNLKNFRFSGWNNNKRVDMKDTGTTPKVNISTILNYQVRYHPYTRLSYSAAGAPNLNSLDLYAMDINSAEQSNGSTTSTITIASSGIKTINMDFNAVDVIDVSGKQELTSYTHRHNGGSANNNIETLFTGCVALSSLDFESSSVTGNLDSIFTGLPELSLLDLRSTRLTGKMTASAFAGTKLQEFNCTGGQFVTAVGQNNFFGNDHIPIANEPPGAVGSDYEGGYYAGTIVDNSNEEYWLVVSDKSHEVIRSRYAILGGNGTSGSTDARTGLDNTTVEFNTSAYEAASYALGLSVTDGDTTYDDWYIPSKSELEMMYRNFKPTSTPNDTSSGNNPHSRPTYTTTYNDNPINPTQTPFSAFQTGGAQAFSTPAPQQYVSNFNFSSGTSGWSGFNGATISVPQGSSNKIRVTQDSAGTAAAGTPSATDAVAGNAGVFRTVTLPAGTYDFDFEFTASRATIPSGSFVSGETYEIVSVGTAPTFNNITYSSINQTNDRITLGSGHGLTNGTIVTFSYVSGVTENFTNLVNGTNYRVVDTAAASVKLEPVGGGGAIDIAQSADVTHAYTITAGDGTDYTFDAGTDRAISFASGTTDPDLMILLGDTATFDLTALSGAHPLYIKTALGSGTTNQIIDSTVTGQGTGNVSFTPTSAGTYYYQCSAHPDMNGSVRVLQRSGTFGIAVDLTENWNDIGASTVAVGANFDASGSYATGTTLYGASVALASSNDLYEHYVYGLISSGTDPDTSSLLNSVASYKYDAINDTATISGNGTTSASTFTVDAQATYVVSLKSFAFDLDVTNISIRSREGYYWTSTSSSAVNTQGIAQNFDNGEQVDVHKDHRYLVRPVRRVSKNSDVSSEQQGTSLTFQPVQSTLVNFTLEGQGRNASTGPNIRGKMPNTAYLAQIQTFSLTNTQIEGIVPDFSNSLNLNKLILSNNNFTGPFAINNPSVAQVEIQNNNLTGIGSLFAANMWKLHGQDNDFENAVPSFVACQDISDINLSRNQFTGYLAGSLSTNLELKKLNLSENALTEGAAQRIFEDMMTNWTANTRDGVTVNLSGNPQVRESRLIKNATTGGIIRELRSAGWTILLNA